MAGKKDGIQIARDRVTLAQLEDNVPTEVDDVILKVAGLKLDKDKKSNTDIRAD
jgi:hypothetical protein